MEARIVSLGSLVLFLGILGFAPRASGDSICVSGSEGTPDAVMIGVAAVDQDLEVTLTWNPDADPAVPRDLVVRDGSGSVVASQPAPLVMGLPRILFPAALEGIGGAGFQFFVQVETPLGPGSEALPFFALRRCSERAGEPCFWQILVGLYAEAVVVSEPLDAALDTYSGCNLSAHLETEQAEYPHLVEEVQQLEQQLALRGTPLGQVDCGYYWQAVVLSSLPMLIMESTTLSTDGGQSDAEVVTFAGDAGHCQAAQARRLSSGMTHPPTVSNDAYHGLHLELRCASGNPQCQGCKAKSRVLLDYQGCAVSSAITELPFGSGMARSQDEGFFSVNGSVVASSAVEALSYGAKVQDYNHLFDLQYGGEPLEALLWSFRELEVAATYTGGVTGGEGAALSGTGFAFTEVANEYDLAVLAQAGAGCPMRVPAVWVSLESPDWVAATAFKKNRGGSIKIEKW